GGVGAMSETWGDVQRAAGASERLSELLTVKPDVAMPVNPLPIPRPAKGAVSFRNVTFQYPSRPSFKALNGFSLAIAPGEAVALVGPSGAGKSTVFQLLLRFYAPQSGTITFDGIDLAGLDPTDLRSNIAVVAQDSVIFSGTLADNIRYGRLGASDADVRRAAEAAAAAEFIERLPNGYETPVGERGVTLSGGQRRRTAIVIAHRLATIQRLKRIVVMDQGRVVGEGSHAELVAHGGLYARLADLQFTSAMALAS